MGKNKPTECLSPFHGRGAYGGGRYHLPFFQGKNWISSHHLTKNKQTLIQAEKTGALAAMAALVPVVFGPRFCVNPQMEWHCKGMSIFPCMRLSVPQSREEVKDNK